MKRLTQFIPRLNIETFLHVRPHIGALLIVGATLWMLFAQPQPHLSSFGGQLLFWSCIALTLLLLVSYERLKKRKPAVLPTSFLDLLGFLCRAACVVTGTVCAWAGLWPATFAYWGLVLLTLSRSAAAHRLSGPLHDNGDEVNAGSIWATLAVDGDGIDMLLYKKRPRTPADEPMARVLVECHQNQVRALGWPEGADIDDEPERVDVYVADVLAYQPVPARKQEEGDGQRRI